MSDNEYEVKFQYCNLCNALIRNINDSFESVSFEILNNGEIHVKFILEKRTEIEEEYIDDIITEYEALQLTNCVKEVLIETGKQKTSLRNLVYEKG